MTAEYRNAHAGGLDSAIIGCNAKPVVRIMQPTVQDGQASHLPTALATRYNGVVETARDPGRSIAVWAARGGHGATTVASVLGAFLQTSVISHDPDAFRWVWNAQPERGTGRGMTVCDAGVIAPQYRHRRPTS